MKMNSDFMSLFLLNMPISPLAIMYACKLDIQQGSLLLSWFNLYPSMDK